MVSKIMWGVMVGVAAGLFAPTLVFAQEEAPPYTEPTEPTITAVGPRTGYGVEVSLGGGVTNFTADAARDATDPGGSWNLRLTMGTRSIVGFEASYIGQAQNVEAAGLDADAYMVGNGAEGAFRLNAPILYRDWLFAPFALAGVGWTRYDLVNADFNTSLIQDDDNVFTIPLGAGVAASYRGVMFDTRFVYRAAYDDDFLGAADLHNWIVSANVGREF
jgi:hypothetical protein